MEGVKVAAFVALAACSRPSALPTVPIAVVSWPSPIRPSCELPPLPELPPLAVYTTTTGTAMERVYVGPREYQDLRQWLHDAALTITAQRRCLEKLTTAP